MSSELRELLAVFNVEVDDKALHHFNENLEGAVEKLAKVGTAIAAAAAGGRG